MLYNRKVSAMVPIKSHSERVVGKNFREFSGRPLYHNILNQLQNTYAVDEIIINTDSEIVMHEAPKHFSKVKILERPENLIGDFVSVNKLIEHDLGFCEGEIFLQTHATNPLLSAETMAKALKYFVEEEDESQADSLFSVNKFQTRFYTEVGDAINHNPNELLRTQDLPPVLEENSCIYIFTKESFANSGRRIGLKPVFFETPRVESIDIDDEFSFKLAELLALYSNR